MGYLRTPRFAAALFAILAFAGPALSEDWPNRSITVVVPLGAGSASDIISRVVFEQVNELINRIKHGSSG